ncbi:MAG TPA: D-alanyl-D-alanine carboxypeptidase family protein [Woeseiaceae bacterium]|nr:D-alanyl-D-alanine carboxypeptidase family protein [Woeseiaceae bacterium]
MHHRYSKLLIPLLFLATCAAARAQSLPTPAPPIIGSKSYLMIDARTGQELAAHEPDLRLSPASLTKLMTAYVVFRALDDGQVTLDEPVTISEKAWRTGGSRMFIEVGNRVPVRDLVQGMIVQSGNDASVALAEHIAGTEDVFAEMMNQAAVTLGMQSSHFLNSTGLPDEDHYSTARDLATLAQAVINQFPDYYKWYSQKEYTWNGITQPNRNNLLWRDDSVDGMKTGHTEDAGYCLVSSAERDGMRIVAVVLGTSSAKARIDGSQALLNYGFRFYETRRLYAAGEAVATARVWKSANEYSELGVLEDVYITIPRGSYDKLEMVRNVPAVLEAPVAAGQPLAEFSVSLDGQTVLTESLRALDDNPEGSLWQRTRDGVSLWFE